MSRLRAALLALAAAAPPMAAYAAGDAARGEKLHEACEQCHGTRLYSSPQRKIDSLRALRKEVQRWGDYYNPRLTKQEVEDLVAFLNERFYRFD
jgi:mono/diheme cytochrome c family protein